MLVRAESGLAHSPIYYIMDSVGIIIPKLEDVKSFGNGTYAFNISFSMTVPRNSGNIATQGTMVNRLNEIILPLSDVVSYSTEGTGTSTSGTVTAIFPGFHTLAHAWNGYWGERTNHAIVIGICTTGIGIGWGSANAQSSLTCSAQMSFTISKTENLVITR